jgi:surface antigen
MFITAVPVNARESVFKVKEEKVPLLYQNEDRIKELENAFRVQQDKIDDTINTVEEIKQETEKIKNSKVQLEQEVQNLRNKVASLKAKLAEKRRLEALRITPKSKMASDAAGNNYAPGNCTYYVKQRRPDISNSFGNANTWYVRAKAMGYKTGTMAKTGAIGTTTAGWLGHVVYVEKWLGDGKIIISEMNYAGLWSRQTRTANESEFLYIYEL